MSRADAVVIAKVVRLEYPDFQGFPGEKRYPDWVVLQVTDELRGDVGEQIRLTAWGPCYQSIANGDLEVGRSYVLPLERLSLEEPWAAGIAAPDPDGLSRVSEQPLYDLPRCAHSALLLEGAKLHTFEFVDGGGRTTEPYMSLWLLKLLFFLGVFTPIRMAIEVAAILVILTVWLVRRNRQRRLAGV